MLRNNARKWLLWTCHSFYIKTYLITLTTLLDEYDKSYPHFRGDETEAQRGPACCPRSCSRAVIPTPGSPAAETLRPRSPCFPAFAQHKSWERRFQSQTYWDANSESATNQLHDLGLDHFGPQFSHLQNGLSCEDLNVWKRLAQSESTMNSGWGSVHLGARKPLLPRRTLFKLHCQTATKKPQILINFHWF